MSLIQFTAFNSCISLTSIGLPNKLTKMESGVFGGCRNLTTVTFQEGFIMDSISETAFSGCDIRELTIPNSIVTIEARAFSNNTNLRNVAFQEISSLININEGAFSYCGLTEISIPNTVTSIGNNAFNGCNYLSKITIGEGVAVGEGVVSTQQNGPSNAFRDVYNSAGIYAIQPDYSWIKVGAWISVTGISIEPNTISIKKDEWKQLLCTVEPDNATLKNVIWSSSNDDIVTVSFIGVIGGISPGTATITVTTIDGSFTATCVVTVSDTINVIGAYIEPSSITINQSEEVSLTPVIIPDNATNKEVVWNSDNIEVASVNSAGLVYGIAAGTVNITATTVDGSIVATCVVTVSDAINVNGFIFNPTTNTIVGYQGSETSIVIPSTIEEYNVEHIGEGAFSGIGIASITIPNSVLTIGSYAFSGCQNLASITFEENTQLSEIGFDTFSYCTSLVNITIPDSVTTIGNQAFSGSGLNSVDISANVISIGSAVFAHCQQLISISVDNSNGMYSSVDGVLYNKEMTTMLQYPAGKASESFTVPGSILNIGDQVFAGSTCLETIMLPEGLLSIGISAFSTVSNMISITIPSSVTSIGLAAFMDCSNLSSIIVSEDNLFYADIDGVLYNKTITELIAYPLAKTDTAITILDSVEVIKQSAFMSNSTIRTITFNETSELLLIEYGAFVYCFGIESLILPNNPIIVGDQAFYYCNALTSITIGSDAQLGNNLLIARNDYFVNAYNEYGAGTYVRDGDTWTKQ